MARIVEHLPVEELEARYRASHDATEARHLQAVWLLAPGGAAAEGAAGRARGPRRGAGGPAPPGDLAAGAGADGAGGGRGAGLGAALGDATGGALQRRRPRGAGDRTSGG